MMKITSNFAKRVLVCASLAFTLPVLTVSAVSPLQVDSVFTIEDTFIRQSAPTVNYGTSAALELANYGTDVDNAAGWALTQQFVSFLKFDISAYTQTVASATCTAAFVKVNIREGSEVFKVSNDWSASDLTWDNAPESFRNIPCYNAVFIDADSAMTMAANTAEDRYLGRWSLPTYPKDNSYTDFDITTALNASILNGDTELSLAFTMSALYVEGIKNRYNRMTSMETTDGVPPCLVITRNDVSTKTSNVDKINYQILSSVGQLVIKNLKGNENIAVFDMQGRSVAKVQALDSQVSLSLKSGVYLIKVAGQESFTTKAVIF